MKGATSFSFLQQLATPSDKKEQSLHEVLCALVDMEANCGRNWRIQVRCDRLRASQDVSAHYAPQKLLTFKH